MRVSDTSIQATSGTMSAHESIDVTVTTNAEFIQMMGTNLYSNQLLAAFREPCCNGWDSHIASGNTHVPMKITLDSDNVLTIRDYGTGIPHNMIGKIYGTYGESTKRNSTKETGGFGLGSKAPFAAVDSFRVTSWHGGNRCTYNMVKSDINKGGMPSITPTVVNVPCGEETGLAVQMHLTDAQTETAMAYLPVILRTGGMEYEMNLQGALYSSKGSKPFLGSEPGSYALDPAIPRDYCRSSEGIFIRYGTVVYPVLEDPTTEKAIGLLRSFMSIIEAKSIVVQAEAGTLGLIPSREGFTRAELTTKGTVKLCLDLVDRMEQEIKDELPDAMQNAIKRAASLGADSFGTGKSVNYGISTFLGKTIHVRYIQSSLYPNDDLKKFKDHLGIVFCQFRSEATRKRIGKLGFRMLNKMQKSYGGLNSRYPGDTYIRKNVQKPVCRMLIPVLSLLPAGIKSIALRYNNLAMYDIYRGTLIPEQLERIMPGDIKDKCTIVLYTNGRRLEDSFDYYPGRNATVCNVFIRLPAKADKRKAVIDYFASTGLTVVNMTESNDWDLPRIKDEKRKQLAKDTAPVSTTEAKPVVKREKDEYLSGISMASWLEQNPRFKSKVRGHVLNTDYQLSSWAGRVESGTRCANPKYFMVSQNASMRGKNVDNNQYLAQVIRRNFPFWLMTQEELESTVIVRNTKDLDYALRNSLTPLGEVIIPRAYAEMQKPEYTEYLTKYRQLKLEECMGRVRRKILSEMGIKLPGLDKMYFNPEFERIYTAVVRADDDYWESVLLKIVPGYKAGMFKDLYHASINNAHEPTRLVSMSKSLENYEYLHYVDWEKDWVTGLEENKPVIKLLVKTAIKLGKSK